MDALSEWGLRVERRHGRGYRLSAALELLDAAAIQPPPGLQLQLASVLASTNTALLDADPAADPQALFAEYQQQGRGRRGRRWQAPYGQQLMGSLAWRFPVWPRDLGCLPLAVGVACAEALEAQGVAGVQLKWPNDLYLGGRKLGGLLMEHRGELGGACRVVIGVGINLRAFPEALAPDQPWTAADLWTARPVSRNRLIGTLLRRLLGLMEAYPEAGFAAWRAAWSARDLCRDQPVRVSGASGFDGIARGVAEDGQLWVETADGLQRVSSGEVSVRLA
jgi:BirA family transcriptional regulator, biotin operon repressor / biotin---[acetyl-CoA-carboxylase] ligase